MKTILKIIASIIIAGIVLFLLIQLIPYGHQHANPAVLGEPTWDSLQTRELAKRACFDCHSNETTWPWYSNIAPMSWLVQRDVDEGRQRLNFSEWGKGRMETREITGKIREGEMPPFYYILMHPNAALSSTEKEILIQGLNATVGAFGSGN
jgi:hypothetical protein